MKTFGSIEKVAEYFFTKDLFELGKTIPKENYKEALIQLSQKQSVRNDIDFRKIKGVIVFRKGKKHNTIIRITPHAINMFKELSKFSNFHQKINKKAIEKIILAYENDERIESTLELIKNKKGDF